MRGQIYKFLFIRYIGDQFQLLRKKKYIYMYFITKINNAWKIERETSLFRIFRKRGEKRERISSRGRFMKEHARVAACAARKKRGETKRKKQFKIVGPVIPNDRQRTMAGG